MITNTGKSIINKYLLGQAPAYASYIAVGCGARPLSALENYGDYSNKTSLDFEMFRVPISSRGIVNENGVEKIVFTAELPSQERYEISEVGVFSAGSDRDAGISDSKTLLSFSSEEGWQYHDSVSSSSIPVITGALDAPLNNNVIATTSSIFQTNSDNTIFSKINREDRYERLRFLNNTIIMAGNTSDLDALSGNVYAASYYNGQISYAVVNAGNFSIGDVIGTSGFDQGYNFTAIQIVSISGSNLYVNAPVAPNNSSSVAIGSLVKNTFTLDSTTSHIHLATSSINLSKYSPLDELKLALSIINKDGSVTTSPDIVRVSMVFSETEQSTERAKLEINMLKGTDPGEYDFDNNRYYSVAVPISGIYSTSNFSWDLVKVVRIYVSIFANGNTTTPSSDYYVAFDSLRIDKTSSQNPLYGLVGYTVVKNENAETIIKTENTNSYVEFRFVVGIT